MTLSSSDLCVQLFRHLAEPALRALALAALTGLVLTVVRAKDAAVRLAVWTTVLYAALAMPFLARVAPAVRLPMPSSLAAHFALAPAPEALRTAAAGSRLRAPAPAPVVAALVAAPAAAQSLRAAVLGQPQGLPLHRALSWPLVVVGLYVLVAGVLLGQLAAGFYLSWRLRHSSHRVGDRLVLSIMLEQSTRCGLRTAPGLAESPSVTVPVTLGAWHPFVLLPTAWRAWSDEKIQAVLAHELSHVVRKDALTRALAAIHRSVFWFSPLAWWLERHLAVLAEQASDDAALGTGADRIFYANVLLGFYHDLQSTPGRVRWEGVAMTRGKQARERVERILDSSRRLSAGLRKSAWGALALLAVPLIYLPAGAQPIFAPKPHADERRALVAPVIRPAVESRYAELQAPPAGPPAPASPATPAAPKAAPAATPGPKSPTPPPATAGEWKYPESDEDVMIFYGQSMSGTGIYRDPDLDHLRALRRASNGDIVWFRRDGKAYIIRDAATVQQAKSIWDGNDLLNKVQELRRQQDAPGVPAPELTDQLKRLKQELTQEMRRQQDAPSVLTDELRKAQTQLDQLQKGAANQEELGGLQHTLRDLREKLAIGKMDAIGGKQGELGALQEQLGKEQEKLAEQQEVLGGLQDTLRDLQEKLATGKMEPNGSKLGDLGVRQEFLGKALEELRERARTATLRRMKQLLDNALAKGLAQPE